MTKSQFSLGHLYDWANSAFATTVMAGFFPLFFEYYWAYRDNGTFYLGIANSIASLIVAVMAPFLGAIADKMSGKKKFLFFFAYLGCYHDGWFMATSAGKWAIRQFYSMLLGTIGFSGANIFYDALLPGVASKKKID